MLKKLLLTAMIGAAAAFGASAATETITWSYASEPCTLGGFGYGGLAQSYGAAVGFYEPDYAGMKIVKIEAYLNLDNAAIKNVSDTKIFISNGTLTPPNLKTLTPAPYVMAEATPVETTWKINKTQSETVAVMSYELDSPFVITDQPLFIGYMLHVDKVDGVAEKYPILLDKNAAGSAGGFFFADENSSAENPGDWTGDYATSGAAVIRVYVEHELFDFGVALGSPDVQYAEEGKDFDLLLQVVNNGKSPVNNLTYAYTVEGYPEVTNTITLPEPISTGAGTNKASVLFPVNAVAESGEYIVDFAITEVDGQPNEALEDATTYFELDVFPYFPKHTPLVEEFTALNCGYCPRGYVAMEYLKEEYPDDAIGICYHFEFSGVKDEMSVTTVPPINGATSFPTASIDRISVIDPYYGDYKNNGMRDLGIVDDIFARAKVGAMADIKISDVSVSLPDSVINVTTEVTFMKNVSSDAYRVGYVLTCDGMFSPTWSQTNYFSRDMEYKDTPLIDQFYKLPGKVYGLTFNDVAIVTKDYRGVANSLRDVKVGVPVTVDYSFDVKDIRNIYRDSLNPYVEIHRMWVNAFVIDRSNGRIVNATRFPVRNVYSGVESVEGDREVVGTQYFDLNGRKVANPQNGIYVRSTTLDDGTVLTDKVVVK